MKIAFVSIFKNLALSDKKIIFLTGDLGFHAFEPIRDVMGDRFINAGVAEQNMVSVAAGLASVGLKPWVYSISSFLTLKTVEQVRNDICHINLSVKLVGFGGGYGYGIMGESHHLLEDIAIYSSFPNMKIYVPAFAEDLKDIVEKMDEESGPSYLRLNLAPSTPLKLKKYKSIRHIIKGDRLTIVVLGSLVHNVLIALDQLKEKNLVDVFVVTELPLAIKEDIYESIKKNKKLLIVEEHTSSGGVGEKVFSMLGKRNIETGSFIHLYAKGYITHLYGDHAFHQQENDLDSNGILRNIKKILYG